MIAPIDKCGSRSNNWDYTDKELLLGYRQYWHTAASLPPNGVGLAYPTPRFVPGAKIDLILDENYEQGQKQNTPTLVFRPSVGAFPNGDFF